MPSERKHPERIWAYDDGAHVMAFDWDNHAGGAVEYVRADTAAALASLPDRTGEPDEAKRHAIALEQCAIFTADVGENIAKSMTDAAAFLRSIIPPDAEQARLPSGLTKEEHRQQVVRENENLLSANIALRERVAELEIDRDKWEAKFWKRDEQAQDAEARLAQAERATAVTAVTADEVRTFLEKHREMYPRRLMSRATAVELLTASKQAVAAASEAFRATLAEPQQAVTEGMVRRASIATNVGFRDFHVPEQVIRRALEAALRTSSTGGKG